MSDMNKKNDLTQQADIRSSAELEEIKSRKLKYGTLATLFTIVFVIAVIVFNIFLGYLTDRFVLEFDMTSENLYEMSEDTKEVIADLDEDITVTVLAEETTYRDSTDLLAQIYEVLQRYQALSDGKINVQYINPDVNPAYMSKYDSLGDLASNDIIVESSRRFKHLTPTNLYEMQSADTDGDGTNDTTYVVGLRAEQRLTSALLYVTADTVQQAAFIKGHGEDTSLDELKSLLTTSNYDVTTISLATEDIPEEVTMLVISSPSEDYTDDEINKIDDFLNDGGNMFVTMTSATTKRLEKLENYFEEWGVAYEQEMVFDAKSCLSGYPMYIVPEVQSVDGITDNLSTGSTMAVIPGARAMKTLFEESGWRYTQVLMQTSDESYAKPTSETITTYDKEANDDFGPFPVCVLSGQTQVDSQLNYTYSYVMFCNAGMVSDSVLELENFLNSKYIVAALNHITQDSDAVVIDAVNYESTTLSLLGSQMTVIFWITVIFIPLAILVLGVVVWVRRRHL